MKLSVVIPCHNAEAYIDQALRSVAAQTHAPHEVIVINDASTDDSVARIRASGVANVIMETDFGNAAAARNVGLKSATGEWIAFLDADDYWYPGHLANAVNGLSRRDSVAWMASRDLVDHNDHMIRRNHGPRFTASRSGMPPEAFVRMLRESGWYFAMSSAVLGAKRLKEIGGLDESQPRRHDLELWLRAIVGHRWAFSIEPTSVYRVDTPGSISRNVSDREYWLTQCLLKNRNAYAGADYEYLLRIAARRSVVSALTDGGERDTQRAWRVAKEILPMRDKFLLALARSAPKLFARANRVRRQRMGPQQVIIEAEQT